MNNTDRLIDHLDLSARITNALHRAGINTVGDLLMCTESQLYSIKGLGKESVLKLLDKIGEFRDNSGPKTKSAVPNTLISSLPITSIGLSIRSTNALLRNGVFSVGDMLSLTEADLYDIRNLGTSARSVSPRRTSPWMPFPWASPATTTWLPRW